jgi:hypothetical protein
LSIEHIAVSCSDWMIIDYLIFEILNIYFYLKVGKKMSWIAIRDLCLSRNSDVSDTLFLGLPSTIICCFLVCFLLKQRVVRDKIRYHVCDASYIGL